MEPRFIYDLIFQGKDRKRLKIVDSSDSEDEYVPGADDAKTASKEEEMDAKADHTDSSADDAVPEALESERKKRRVMPYAAFH